MDVLSQKKINIINKVHKRALKTIYNDSSSSFEELLLHDNTICFHKRHLQILMLEVFKSVKHENPLIIEELFEIKEQRHNLRNKFLLKIPPSKSKTYGTNSLLFRASIIWNTLPNKYKIASSISEFKSLIKSWDGDSCKCFICT